MSVRGMDFEASLTSGIVPDLKRIRRYDDNRRIERESIRSLRKGVLVLIPIAAGLFLWNRIVGIAAGVIALIIILIVFKRTHIGKKAVIESYTEGNMVPGLIVNLNPLTVMAISSLNIDDDHPSRYGCFKLETGELPDINIALYEKVPCSCTYAYKYGPYHYGLQAFPLCWATSDRSAMDRILFEFDKWNAVNSDEYEVIKRVAAEYPALKNRNMLLLDENYQAIGMKYYSDEEYQPVNHTLNKEFPKEYHEVNKVDDPIPAAEFYNRMIELSVKDGVYEYISAKGQKAENPHVAENTGFLTYISDAVVFMEAVAEKGNALSLGEYPLLMGRILVTTKGVWKKKKFIPWTRLELDVDPEENKEMWIRCKERMFALFPMNREYFVYKDSYNQEDWNKVMEAEKQNMNVFLNDLAVLCADWDRTVSASVDFM